MPRAAPAATPRAARSSCTPRPSTPPARSPGSKPSPASTVRRSTACRATAARLRCAAGPGPCPSRCRSATPGSNPCAAVKRWRGNKWMLPMNDTRVALLIDADNLSGDVIEQAIEHLLKLHGAIHFRRAYCSPQKVVEHIDLFRRHSIRPMVNVPTGKNSTDIALAVDVAISESPDVVVIASSDSDYAPLAQRLREKG